MTRASMIPARLLRSAQAAGVALLLAAAGGCATVQNPHPLDPWEPMNRSISQFNEGIDDAVLRPVATVYKQHVPPLVRTGVSNFFGNLGDAWSAVNSALQFKFGQAAENILRFQVNTFFGFGGILDIASTLNIERHKEDFGQTLGRWYVPSGPYLVLPFLGPSTLRDTVALPVDRRYDLLRQVDPQDTRRVLVGARIVDARANLLRVGTVLDEAALDKYTFTRDAYLQRRRTDVLGAERADRTDPATGRRAPPGAAPAPAPAAPASR